ncbi:MAG: hypothetical protein LBR07_01880 [Puniceicoccales bacterium]|jgi:4-hydroxybenzoate polyprenyltransferase|nr:hypothetical protein [Puniceicoccales bacterium]
MDTLPRPLLAFLTTCGTILLAVAIFTGILVGLYYVNRWLDRTLDRHLPPFD